MKLISTNKVKKLLGIENYGTLIYHLYKAGIRPQDAPKGEHNPRRQYYWDKQAVEKIKKDGK